MQSKKSYKIVYFFGIYIWLETQKDQIPTPCKNIVAAPKWGSRFQNREVRNKPRPLHGDRKFNTFFESTWLEMQKNQIPTPCKK